MDLPRWPLWGRARGVAGPEEIGSAGRIACRDSKAQSLLATANMRRVNRILAPVSQVVVFAVLATAAAGCASLKLNGCRRIEPCGAQGAYVCEGDLICADRDGNTIRSEPISTRSRSRSCGICDGNPG
jgi:hypothetical protein